MRYTGVTSRGIIMPIFKNGDDLSEIIPAKIVEAAENENFSLNDGDIISITESVVARAQGNYATCEQIAKDVRSKINSDEAAIIFPILSRNRFATMLKAFSMAFKKIYIQLSYPADEVGNELITWDMLDSKKINPYSDNFNEKEFRALFGDKIVHRFTGIDYIDYYKSFGDNIEIIFSNDPRYVLNFTKNVINCDIHTRKRTQRILKEAGAVNSLRMDEIMTSSIDGSGYNEEYGLLGANKATEDSVKLFPRNCMEVVEKISEKMNKLTGKNIEVMIYGDGCFKDPVGGIWELADPIVSPAYTKRLSGTPNEIKMKYFADNELSGLSGEALSKAMKDCIKSKDNDLVGNMNSEGTTPRRLTDLLGSLSDLTSGSGDRGTPVVLIQGYFTNYATD